MCLIFIVITITVRLLSNATLLCKEITLILRTTTFCLNANVFFANMTYTALRVIHPKVDRILYNNNNNYIRNQRKCACHEIESFAEADETFNL